MDKTCKIIAVALLLSQFLGASNTPPSLQPDKTNKRSSSSPDDQPSKVPKNSQSDHENFSSSPNNISSMPEPGYSTEPFKVQVLRSKIESQVKVLGKICPFCNESLNSDLFPASFTLKKITGISRFPYEERSVCTVGLHVKKCFSCQEKAYHRECFLFRTPKNASGYSLVSFGECLECGKVETSDERFSVIMNCLEKSTRPYELAYICKTLGKYKEDLVTVLKSNNTSSSFVEKITKKVKKCQFKGKRYLISSLELYLHDKDMDSFENDQIIAVLCKYLNNTVEDPKEHKYYVWEKLLEKCTDNKKIAEYIMKIIECFTEEHAEKHKSFCKWMLYSYLNLSNRRESVQFIRKYLFSKHSFLFSCLELAVPLHQTRNALQKNIRSKNLYTAADLVNVVEQGLQKMSHSFGKHAYEAGSCFSAIPLDEKKQDFIPLIFYLKKIMKLAQELESNNSRELKNQYLFYNTLATRILSSNGSLPLPNQIALLKICMFYNKQYRSVIQKSSFLAFLFKDLSFLFISDATGFENLIISLSEKEFNEMIILKALNHNRKELLYRFDIPVEEFKMKYAAESLASNGRNLMYVGLKTVPQLCKKHCSSAEYKRFLHDVCFATQLPLCTLADEIADDLLVESTNYPVHDTGLLPLIPRFYDSLRCEAWLEKDVAQWCERNNFPELIYTLWNAEGKNIKYRFIKRHLKTILQHVLDKTGDIVSTKEQAELVVWCWGNALDGEKESILNIFEALAALPNGYYHANIFFLMHRAKHGTEIARRLMERIISTNKQNGNDAFKLQMKFIEFTKAWEAIDVILEAKPKCTWQTRCNLIDKLERLRNTRLEGLFADFMGSSSALDSIKEHHGNFYSQMLAALDYIPQAALGAYSE
ncbi:hypothetical protein ENBRE01_1961 [Enteropsectra breve]|nr:hypothetical protein ENBRE01_1961 [Enteropsectra breve]